MQETSLHAALKDLYTRADDCQEVPVDGYLVDVVSDNLLIEIQTRNFAALRRKLAALLPNHPVRLVHPIAQEKWIIRLPAKGDKPVCRRKSPRRGRLEHLFLELVHIPHLVVHPNFTLEILLIKEEEIRRDDGLGSWRRKGVSIINRRLLEVIDRVLLTTSDDFRVFIPPELTEPFTSADLAAALNIPPRLAGKMAFCLRYLGVTNLIGKRGNSYLYTTTTPTHYTDLHKETSS